MTAGCKGLNAFVRTDEGGAITYLMLVLFIGILLMTGIALDLAKHESQRADLQSATDRGTLAAASLRQKLTDDTTTQTVDDDDLTRMIESYVATRTLSKDSTNVTVKDNITLNARTIGVSTSYAMPTDFFRMVGVSTLDVGAASRAVQKKTNVEISLVLDVSGTMRWNNAGRNPGPGDSRIEKLKPAAKQFIDTVTANGTNANVTLNIIPYAGNVNPGREMFAELGGVRYLSVADAKAELPAGTSVTKGNDYQSVNGVRVPVDAWFRVAEESQTMSSCLEVAPGDFPPANPAKTDSRLRLPANGTYDQVPHFNRWGFSNAENAIMDWGWCPIDEQEDGTGSMAIKYMSSNATELKDYIDQLMLHDGTSTYIGMKYGLALLNPAESTRINSLSTVGDAFPDRPAAWDDQDTMKIVVLMTDGMYNEQWRPSVPLDISDDVVIPRSEGEIGGGNPRVPGLSSQGDIDGVYNDTCDAAKTMGVTVFTIAFDAPGGPANQMRRCASSSSHFYEVDLLDIGTAFQSIAATIDRLKLTM